MGAEKSNIHLETLSCDTVPVVDFLEQLDTEFAAIFHQFDEVLVSQQLVDSLRHGDEDRFVEVFIVACLAFINLSYAHEEALSVVISRAPLLKACLGHNAERPDHVLVGDGIYLETVWDTNRLVGLAAIKHANFLAALLVRWCWWNNIFIIEVVVVEVLDEVVYDFWLVVVQCDNPSGSFLYDSLASSYSHLGGRY